jgi:dual specificity tyrosine-phosphorylation-regulated kinase 2/3/4
MDSQPSLNFSRVEEPVVELEYPSSRSESATSSLDPYYFGLQSPSFSPAPPLPGSIYLSATPEMYPNNDPTSPPKNPAAIDRRGLVGVGELTTPRWAKSENSSLEEMLDDEGEDYEVVLTEDMERDGPDSPWTIEAIDGDSDEVCRSAKDIAPDSSPNDIPISRPKYPLPRILCAIAHLWLRKVAVKKYSTHEAPTRIN